MQMPYRLLVPAKFVYVLVRMRTKTVKYEHKLRGESFSAWEETELSA